MDFRSRYKYNPKTDILGRGGFATVYRAQDTLLNRVVALKFFTHNDSNKNSLISEISRAISLEHPNLCRYYDANMLESLNLHGELEKTEVGVMEYIDSGDLKSFLHHNISYFNKLLIDVLEGLSYLHSANIIHRDLKPQNILIKSTVLGPIAKITDFGISKTVNSGNTNASQLMGTIEYMAPEQFSPQKYGINGRISTNLDLWSFGLMVYELIMGETMFGGKGGHSSAEQVMTNILSEDLVEERVQKIPEPYKQIIQRCIIKDANLRVQSAVELIRILKAHRDDEEEIINTIKALRGQTANNGFTDTGMGADETRLIDGEDTATRVIHLAGNETMVIEMPQFTPPNDIENEVAGADAVITPEDELTEVITQLPETNPVTKEKRPAKGKIAHKAKQAPLQTETKVITPHIKEQEREIVSKAEILRTDEIKMPRKTSQRHKLVLPLIILGVLIVASVWVFISKQKNKDQIDYDYAMRHYGDTQTDFLQRLISAANNGNDSAMLKLAEYYNSKKQYNDAIKVIDPLARKNSPGALKILSESQYQIGLMLYLKKDSIKAFDYFTQSVKTNNAKAETMLGNLYYNGFGNLKKDYKQAFVWYSKAAIQNNDYGRCGVGLMYSKGDGVAQNADSAKKYFEWVVKNGAAEETKSFAQQQLIELNK